MSEMRHSKAANKRQKEHGFCVLVNKVINEDVKRQPEDFTKSSFAHEIGIASEGSLSNKLKKGKTDTDITVTELMHIIELTGDLRPLEYLCHMFDQQMVTTLASDVSLESIHDKTDILQIECSEAFSTIKQSLKDDRVTEDEKSAMIAELNDTLQAAMELKGDVKNIQVKDG